MISIRETLKWWGSAILGQNSSRELQGYRAGILDSRRALEVRLLTAPLFLSNDSMSVPSPRGAKSPLPFLSSRVDF